jgi:hypothetical protein
MRVLQRDRRLRNQKLQHRNPGRGQDMGRQIIFQIQYPAQTGLLDQFALGHMHQFTTLKRAPGPSVAVVRNRGFASGRRVAQNRRAPFFRHQGSSSDLKGAARVDDVAISRPGAWTALGQRTT